MTIEFYYDNIMTVDGKYLSLNRTRSRKEAFSKIIEIANPLILQQLEKLNTKMINQNPDATVSGGSIWLGRLAVEDIRPYLTENGIYRKETTQIDRGVFYSAYNDLKPESFINDYWNIVEENWLTAQIRLSGNGAIKKGWHLMASYALNVVEKGEDYYSDLYRR